jgi:hypothetical protein
MAGGPGYALTPSGTGFAVPGGGKDPATIYANTSAEKWAGVAPSIAQAGGVAAAEGPYKPPVTYSQLGPDGVYHDVTVPLPAWAAATGGGGIGANSAAPPASGSMPAPVYAQRVQQFENPTGNPAAPNASGPGGAPTSSAVGNGQFLSNTWLPLYKQTFPQQAQGMSDPQILALRSDPGTSAAMTLAYARQNAPALQQAGQPPTAANLALAHRFGPQGALSLLQASPDAAAGQVLGPAVLAANPTLQGQTVGRIVGSAAMQYGQAPVDLTGGAPGLPTGALVGKPQYTPEQTGASAALGDINKQIVEAGSKAPTSLQRLDIIQNAAQAFRPGATADMRLDGSRMMVDALQGMGIQPPQWLVNGAAGGETIGKEGGFLAAEMTRQLGSREAMGIFNQVRNIQPNISMSSGGFDVIVNSIRQGVLRDQDLSNFRDQWMTDPSHSGSINGMIPAFERQFPPQAYASRVVPYPVPKTQDSLIPNVIYRGPTGLAIWSGTGFKPIGSQ